MDQNIRGAIQSELEQLDRVGRAELCEELVRSVYEHVKFNVPGGEGFDGRDGAERQGFAKVLDAAINAKDEALKSRR